MIAASFHHVRHWVFDLDNTLYPPSDRLFDQIEVRMGAFIERTLGVSADEANHLRAHYWRTYGTTLAGLMAEHDLPPEDFMVDVHAVDMRHMGHDLPLRSAIDGLPGRKIVFTNGSRPYAHRVLAARGLSNLFDEVYGVEHAGYIPKPAQQAFDTVFAMDGVDPGKGAMFEDDLNNLRVPKASGMRTVYVAPDPAPNHPHVDHHTSDLADFLSQVM